MKKTGLNGQVHDFIVDYDAAAVDDKMEIYNYLIKENKHSITKCLGLLKGVFYKTSIFIESNKGKFVQLYLNEQSKL